MIISTEIISMKTAMYNQTYLLVTTGNNCDYTCPIHHSKSDNI